MSNLKNKIEIPYYKDKIILIPRLYKHNTEYNFVKLPFNYNDVLVHEGVVIDSTLFNNNWKRYNTINNFANVQNDKKLFNKIYNNTTELVNYDNCYKDDNNIFTNGSDTNLTESISIDVPQASTMNSTFVREPESIHSKIWLKIKYTILKLNLYKFYKNMNNSVTSAIIIVTIIVIVLFVLT